MLDATDAPDLEDAGWKLIMASRELRQGRPELALQLARQGEALVSRATAMAIICPVCGGPDEDFCKGLPEGCWPRRCERCNELLEVGAVCPCPPEADEPFFPEDEPFSSLDRSHNPTQIG